MSQPKPPPGGNPPEGKPDEPKPGEPKPREAGKSGRVTFDSRGNAVWEWATSTGEFGRNIDTRRLKKLEAKDLKIADDPGATQPVKKSGSPGPAGKTGGFDPYNSAGGRITPRTRKPLQKPKDLRRLSEWIQLQKSLRKKPGEEPPEDEK